VMMVKTTAALSRQSCTPRICARACLLVSFGAYERSLQWLVMPRIPRSADRPTCHLDSV
jgi:hypothetical protein